MRKKKHLSLHLAQKKISEISNHLKKNIFKLLSALVLNFFEYELNLISLIFLYIN